MEEMEIKKKNNVVKIIAGAGFTQPGNVLCKVKNTGNGFIAKFPSWNCVDQDNYICLDYAEAQYLRLALEKFEECNKDEEWS